MDPLHARLDALERQTHTLARQLRWWRGLAGGLLALAGLTWALPAVTAPAEPTAGGREHWAQPRAVLETLWPLLRYVTIATDDEGRPEVRITGANLRIVNGLGSTDCLDEAFDPLPDCPNGLGNLIVGYNERRHELSGENVRTGSHNVVVGQEHNFSRVGGLVVGQFHEISGDYAAVSGGIRNTASGDYAAVSGGIFNEASGDYASVSGGEFNRASHDGAAVSGGRGNTASARSAAVSGGIFNEASGDYASVSGGGINEASGDYAAVSGGHNRTAAGEFDWVAGDLVADE